MQFSTIYSRVESLCNVTGQRALIKDAIQVGLYRATSKDLPYLMTESFITTVAPYETGTATPTNGSTSVSGTNTVWTSAMVGRKIRFGSENAYYRIATFTSTTSITLEAPYQGTQSSAGVYSIFKDEYRLPADLDSYKVMRQIENSIALIDIENTAFDVELPTPKSEGSPVYSILSGSKLDTYSTGTVSITVNTSTLTGVGTAWTSVEGLTKGSKITIGSATYTVKTIDSATSITLYELASTTVTTSTYSISLDNYIIQFYTIPDAAENIYFKYQRLPYPLISDQDIPDLPDQWHHILIEAGCIWAWETKDKAESKVYEGLFAAHISEMWARIGYISKTRNRKRMSQDELTYRQYPVGARLPQGYGYPIRLY